MTSTYVNDLRLNELGTGDGSGTWGTTTNTNLELIGEALSFGTEGITTNADTHTTTVADGASDAGRAMYIKYTGTLDSACTITIGPNTMSRVHFIENGTSGSQNIIISQGSGANITIPPGDVKVVYLDGAGSGAAVVDAFASLNVVDLKVQDDLTLSSDSAVVSFGVDGDTTLTHTDGTGLTLNSTNKLCFNDASQFIQGASATVLDIAATDTIELTATTTAIVGNQTVSGTLVPSGVLTANAGVVVDTMTLDAATLTATGDFTASIAGTVLFDAAGDIVLDAAGDDILLKSGGTHEGNINLASSNLTIKSIVSDKDIIFQGNDGGSAITALTLDMSAAGAATFNNDVTAFSDKRLKTDVTDIENALEKVQQMQGVYYRRNDVENAKMQVGVLAQDMEKILPEVVLTADDEMQTKSVDYGKITSVLIEAVKELSAKVKELEGK
jgi:hypothetical protein